MKLTHLTDKTLLHEMISLVHRERALLAEILWRLKEIDRRKLYSDQKCGSLFEYCVKVLKYSEGQASRRVTACRLLRELPAIMDDIKSGEINLTQLNQAKHFFNEMGGMSTPEKMKIINEIKGKTIKATEEILWKKKDPDGPRKVSIILNQETVDRLQQVRALKAHSCLDLDSVLVKMTELALKEWAPTLVQRQRGHGKGESRYVQVGVKAQVWQRDKGKCRNCHSTFALQIDHLYPYSFGGKTDIDNLQLLCRNCNQRKGFDLPQMKKGPFQGPS